MAYKVAVTLKVKNVSNGYLIYYINLTDRNIIFRELCTVYQFKVALRLRGAAVFDNRKSVTGSNGNLKSIVLD